MPRHFSTERARLRLHQGQKRVGDEGSAEGDRSRPRRSILLVRREPPLSLTFLSTLPSLAGGGRLERQSRLRAAGHTGEDGNGSQTSSGKKEKRKKKGSFEGELTVVESVCSCLVQRGSAKRVTVLVNRGLIKEI